MQIILIKNLQKMESMQFNTNWNNKLQCSYYTTIRLHNKNRFEGMKVNVILKNKFHHEGQIIKIENCLLANIGDRTAYIDTGYNREGFCNIIKTMYKNKCIDWNTKLLDVIIIKRLS